MTWSLQKTRSTGLVLCIAGIFLLGFSVVYFTRQEFNVIAETSSADLPQEISRVMGLDLIATWISIAIMAIGLSLYYGSMYVQFRNRKRSMDKESA